MNDPHWDQLIHGHLDDALTESERAEFETLMIDSASARRRFWELAEVHGLAGEAARLTWAEDAAQEVPMTSMRESAKQSWLQWRPLAAAAAVAACVIMAATFRKGAEPSLPEPSPAAIADLEAAMEPAPSDALLATADASDAAALAREISHLLKP